MKLRYKDASTVVCITFSYSLAWRMLIPVIPIYFRSLGGTILELGILSLGFGLGLTIFEPVWGWISDRTARKKVVIAVILLSSPTLFAYSIAKEVWLFAILKFIQGVSISGVGVSMRALMADISTSSKRGEAFGLLGSAMSLSYVLGPFVGGYIMSAASYSWCFFTSSFLTLVPFLIAYNIRTPIKTTAETENGEIKQTLNILEVLAVASFLIFFYYFCLGAFNDIMPVYANESEAIRATPIEIGLMFTVMYTVGIPSQLFFGRLSDKIGRKVFIVPGMVLAGLAFSMFPIAKDMWQLTLLATLFAIGGAAVSPLLLALLADNIPKSVRGKFIGIYGASEDLGITFGPLSVAYVYEFYGATDSLRICSILILFGALLGVALLKKIRLG